MNAVYYSLLCFATNTSQQHSFIVRCILLKLKKAIVSHILSFKTHFILNNEPKVVMDITFQLKNTTVKVHTLKAGMSSAYI